MRAVLTCKLNALMRVVFSTSSHGDLGDVVSTAAIANDHVEGCRSRAFFVVAVDRHAVEAWTSEEQALKFIRLTMVVEVDWWI